MSSKATNQQERIKLWKQNFENLLRNPPKVTHEPITRIISKQLDIKLGPFTSEELDSVLRNIKNRKAAGLDEIPPEVWKTRQVTGQSHNITKRCAEPEGGYITIRRTFCRKLNFSNYVILGSIILHRGESQLRSG